MLLKIIDCFADRARQEGVIRVEPGDDVSMRALPTLIDGGGLPHVGLALPFQPARIFGEYPGRFVRRAIVKNQVLYVWIVLGEDTFQSVSQKLRLIESRRNY